MQRQGCLAADARLASDDDRFIISETLAGVIERHELRTGQVTRSWPDGAEETFPADSPSASPDASDDLRDEFRLDYARSRPNWFASRMRGTALAIDPRVASAATTQRSSFEPERPCRLILASESTTGGRCWRGTSCWPRPCDPLASKRRLTYGSG